MNLLLIDDERLARTELRRMLLELPSPPEVTEASSAEEARRLLGKSPVDAILLDIEMPGESGFDLLDSLGDARPPVIFTTAYSEFATRAFESGAVDYLLKPFGQQRLEKAISRLIPATAATFGTGDRILLKIDGECVLLPVEEIEMIESLGREGSLIHWGEACGRARQTIGRLESRLDPTMFFRASRERIVNLRAIASMTTSEGGILSFFLRNGERVNLSRRQGIVFRRNHSA